MKKYLITGGLAAVLMLGACGNEVPEASEEIEAEESADQSENESSNDNSEALEELRAENESLQERITEMEEEDEEVESLQERITELEEENKELEEIAASVTDDEDIAEEEESENNSENEDDKAENESDSAGKGTRSDPMQIGNTVQLDVMINGDDYDNRYEASAELTINEIIIGQEAYDMLIAENQFNDPAPEGYQWALIHANFELVESETEDHSYYVMNDFKIVEEDGSAAPRESAVTPESYGNDHLYSGGTSSGYTSFLVPEDNNFLIHYDDLLYNSVFFKID